MKLIMEQWRKHLNEGEGAYYHITRSENVPSIMAGGLEPTKPRDMEDVEGVYLFKSAVAAEDALMNWLGDRFDEDEPLTLLRVDSAGVGELDAGSAAGFEAISKTAIAPEFISVEQKEI
jgi:hypothetical protein